MMQSYWNEELETMDPVSLRRLEGELLTRQAEYVCKTNPYFEQQFAAAGVKPEHIRDVADLARLPFMEKTELTESQRNGALFGLNQCATTRDVIRMVATGGTTGQPLRLGYTRQDIEVYKEQGARALWAMGCRPDDIVFNCFNYALYAGGIADHGAFETLGATILPYSVRNSQRLLGMMGQLEDELCLYSTPSYAIL